ncbi:hypothetical protein SRH_02840 [Mesomycoplasma hyorhinis MCLD]|uniref:Uncharacterized protein n=1 Tax=Mesomycoplasma hyorhinis (strain MCLD) TaxID=936139 RepID=A0ABM5M6M4_MESHM|nr:hypothetical protein SRH_02840 [Mesomycoplasma hyorhinis MCLD]
MLQKTQQGQEELKNLVNQLSGLTKVVHSQIQNNQV